MAGNAEFSRDKYDALYACMSVAFQTNDPIAINRAIWNCDMAAYRDLGASITGATWYKIEDGVAVRELTEG